ncbi:NAD(P)H-binding protein [Lacticaseibacillus baoqingensis]|uniref:NAD(P)H-binding protein n=1 Tax=Lacticaseibacillus baoqingensis TaxID=2486013 RepID=A0ABW4E5G4_9LACO|nr:NAD(P)H-binding protein [Lacticaseibacillus baoqingensis]
MSNVLILGAHGQIARRVEQRLLQTTDAKLTLYLRQAARLGRIDPVREAVVEADVRDFQALYQALTAIDIVYANLTGALAPLAANIVGAMTKASVKRLVMLTPANPDGVLDAALTTQRITDSSLDYTLIQTPSQPHPDALAAREQLVALIVKVIVNPD